MIVEKQQNVNTVDNGTCVLTLLFKCTYEKQREKQTFGTFEAMSMCLMLTLRMLEVAQSSSVRTKEKAKPPVCISSPSYLPCKHRVAQLGKSSSNEEINVIYCKLTG